MKTYRLMKVHFGSVPTHQPQEGYQYDRLLFVNEVDADADNVAVKVEALESEPGTLYNLVRLFYPALIRHEIHAVRFLPEGISVLRPSRYYSTHESNPWLPILERYLKNSPWSNETTDESTPEGKEISEAFQKYAVLVKPGKFLTMLGATPREAEEFSRQYAKQYTTEPEKEYTIEEVEGKDIVTRAYFNNPDRNSSPLIQSCMADIRRRTQVGWYAKQKPYIGALILTKDGKTHARCLIWRQAEVTEKDGTLIYSGPIADRIYYYNRHALQAIKNVLKAKGVPYRENVETCDRNTGFILEDGQPHLFTYYKHNIRARIKSGLNKRTPFIDTLCIVSDKYAANYQQEGKNVEASRVDGVPTDAGTYYRVTSGIRTGMLTPWNDLYRVILPDGQAHWITEETAQAQADKLTPAYRRAESGSPLGRILLLRDCTKVETITIPEHYGGNRTILTQFYPQQLAYDLESGTWKVAKLWSEEAAELKPIEGYYYRNGDIRTRSRR